MEPNKRRETLEEATILKKLKHPNIIKFKEVYKTKGGKLNIVMDYCDDGDLSEKIKDRFKIADYMTEEELLDKFTQIALAVKYIHDHKIIHRDLKGQNIFCTSKGILKLGDFGVAKVLGTVDEKV